MKRYPDNRLSDCCEVNGEQPRRDPFVGLSIGACIWLVIALVWRVL